MKTVAIMQPYFFPYAGYFCLPAVADHFVILDCVQFPRRGRVHRCELPVGSGLSEWLTLPLAKQPQATLIKDLQFADDAVETFRDRLKRHQWLTNPLHHQAEQVLERLADCSGPACDYVCEILHQVTGLLKLDVIISRSSHLRLPESCKRQERILEIAKALGATRYVNASGGVYLYDHATFAEAGIELAFLQPYRGIYRYMLHALYTATADQIRRDVIENAHLNSSPEGIER